MRKILINRLRDTYTVTKSRALVVDLIKINVA